MSSTSPEDGALGTGAGLAGDANTDKQARPPPRKRRRVVVSCTECHRRKQKCDRKFPCTNCVARNKQSTCKYETGAPTAKRHGGRATAGPVVSLSPPDQPGTLTSTVVTRDHDHDHDHDHAHDDNQDQDTTPLQTKAASFGYSHTGASTLGFLHRIETAPAPSPSTSSHPPSHANHPPNSNHNPYPKDKERERTTQDRYRTLIRQLPPRNMIQKLASLYFKEFNPQYAMLDRDVFERQLGEWYAAPAPAPVSVSVTAPAPVGVVGVGGRSGMGGRDGNGEGEGEMRAFPAVVFQVCAVALLVVGDDDGGDGDGRMGGGAGKNGGSGVSDGDGRGIGIRGGEGMEGEAFHREEFEGLKYAGGMTFEDLAREYTDLGVEVLAVLGKRGMGLNTVIAGWMRSSWLKYVGWVTESWHAIGSAIRDAQEIGLHRDSLDPKPASDDAEAVLENQWVVQRRRKAWMTLVMWDIHMACTLGRPTTTNLSMAPPSLPVDAPVPKDRSRTPVVPRGEYDPPTPLSRCLWGHHIMRPLKEILDLEKDGPCPKDFSRVDRLHNELLDLEAKTPSYFRVENPDTRFDALPECYWLPVARVILPQLSKFELMALHRPYIFTRPRSRTEALKASLGMLHVQRLHFMALPPQMYKTFSLFFGTFDAIVLMASIYILFPKEHPELVQNALQHFQWAVERFQAMSGRNSLAKAALGVLQAICLRLMKSLGISGQTAQCMVTSGSSSTSPASGTASSSIAASIWNSPTTATTSFNPSPSMPSKASLSSAARSTPGNDFVPRQTQMDGGLGSTPASSNPTPDFNFNFNLNLDPELFPADANAAGSTFDWNPPSNFDWSSLQPIYATCDLVYHDLVGTGPQAIGGAVGSAWGYHEGAQGDDEGQGQGQGEGQGADAGSMGLVGGQEVMGMGTGAVSGTAAGGEGGLPGYGLFGGDFGDDSVWSLLNQYTSF